MHKCTKQNPKDSVKYQHDATAHYAIEFIIHCTSFCEIKFQLSAPEIYEKKNLQ